MAARALEDVKNECRKTYIVAAGQVVTKGRAVQFAAADDEVQIADAANDKHIGIAMSSGVAGERVQVELLFAKIVPVIVGTGGATRGEWGRLATDGYTDQTLGGVQTVKYCGGVFLQSGVAGDWVGLGVGALASGAA